MQYYSKKQSGNLTFNNFWLKFDLRSQYYAESIIIIAMFNYLTV